MRFNFIDAQSAEFPITILCRVMKVSRSGFHEWKTRPLSNHAKEDVRLTELIKKYHHASNRAYGSPRIWGDLLESGEKISKKRVERLMKQSGLRGKKGKKFRCLTDSSRSKNIAPNLVKQNFDVEKPDMVWSSDLTEFWTPEGKLYMAVVLDLFARFIVGFAMGSRITRHLVLEAVKMALMSRRPRKGLIFHSDKGSQYAADDTKALLEANKITPSMSGTGNCYDNAVSESVFARLKEELGDSFPTREQAQLDVFEYVAVFYNRKRRHSYNGNLSPLQVEQYYEKYGRRVSGLKELLSEKQNCCGYKTLGKPAPSLGFGNIPPFYSSVDNQIRNVINVHY